MEENKREKLAEYRQKLNEERELKFQIHQDLENEYQKLKVQNFQEKYENKYAVAAVIFFFTLILLYIILFFLKFVIMIFFGIILAILGINLDWLNPVLHFVIWSASIYSVYRKKSVLDDLRDFFF